MHRVDYCQYGASFLKPTRLMMFNCGLNKFSVCRRVGGVCSRTHQKHESLQGRINKYDFVSSRFSYRPHGLCVALARFLM